MLQYMLQYMVQYMLHYMDFSKALFYKATLTYLVSNRLF